MGTFWVGTGLEISYHTPEGDTLDSLRSTNLGPNVQDGDTVIRWLIEWYLITTLHENNVVLDQAPLPWVAGVFFTPNYNALGSEVDSFDLITAEVGDAIYTERTRWAPVRWTDGTLHSTQRWAGSPGVVDIHSKRTFRDHSSDRIWIGVQDESSNFGPNFVDVMVQGYVRIKCLVQR